jgi:Prolyl oligopeptidase family
MALADGPADNSAQAVRAIPPPGIKIDDAARKELEAGLEQLQASLVELRQSKAEQTVKYLPDVEIFEKSLRVALTEDGFFEPRDVEGARKLLSIGVARAEDLKQGRLASWLGCRGEVGMTVRGYRSRLDGSVQPYGVAWNRPSGRGDVWCRGRSEKGLELQFILKQLNSPDPLPVPGVCMVYPLGRYCNANKLAGEVDTLEALEHACKEYPIQSNQVAIRGFSMGGAAAWHLAVHYPDKWFAATPGAGFSETPDFLKVFQSETLTPALYEETLWQMYDCNKWALNLKNLPTIAYSGAIDKQKQAADVMARACWNLPKDDRFELTHIVAPNTAHLISRQAKEEIERRLSVIHSMSKWEETPKKLWFTTYTLKYNRCHWLTIDQLEQHWKQATVKATLDDDLDGNNKPTNSTTAIVYIRASGVTELTINFEANQLPERTQHLSVLLRDSEGAQERATPAVDKSHSVARRSDLSFRATFRYDAVKKQWGMVDPLESTVELRKQHDLQGPIDDAFMNSFLFVRPSTSGQHSAVDQWVNAEFDHAVTQWHKQMRGDVRIVAVDELKESDIKNHNIVLWGDPKSNLQIAAILAKLPIQWSADDLAVGSQKFDARHHVPVMIYPNPAAPDRYIVLNSSFTYREYDYLNNARQVPKLPDWAMIDIRTAADARQPGKVVAADFFGEKWEVR